eukprot:TRINITY_DN25930_c0_g1_i1.p1 TRINITY_DN25930_c0_g1~~TRINITY_DN25930_c0_g1_i1.p1  ORF type:complete len:293 (+),score=81.33 TRINITY_DN25930_c0_g1_i1:45-923(+)
MSGPAALPDDASAALPRAARAGPPAALSAGVTYVRLCYRGQRKGTAKVLRVEHGDEVGAAVPGRLVVAALAAEGVDAARFGAAWYHEGLDGYLALREEDIIPRGHHQREGVDVELSENVEWTARAVSRLAASRGDDRPETGYFGVGIVRGKTASNHGILWRSAYQLGAAFIFTIGARYDSAKEGAVDTYGCARAVPCFHYDDWAAFAKSAPFGAPLVGVETGGEPLDTFEHPPCAVYLLGSEDSGIPPAALAAMHHTVSIPAARGASYNVAVAGSLVMYDRFAKRARGAPEE